MLSIKMHLDKGYINYMMKAMITQYEIIDGKLINIIVHERVATSKRIGPAVRNEYVVAFPWCI